MANAMHVELYLLDRHMKDVLKIRLLLFVMGILQAQEFKIQEELQNLQPLLQKFQKIDDLQNVNPARRTVGIFVLFY